MGIRIAGQSNTGRYGRIVTIQRLNTELYVVLPSLPATLGRHLCMLTIWLKLVSMHTFSHPAVSVRMAFCSLLSACDSTMWLGNRTCGLEWTCAKWCMFGLSQSLGFWHLQAVPCASVYSRSVDDVSATRGLRGVLYSFYYWLIIEWLSESAHFCSALSGLFCCVEADFFSLTCCTHS